MVVQLLPIIVVGMGGKACSFHNSLSPVPVASGNDTAQGVEVPSRFPWSEVLQAGDGEREPQSPGPPLDEKEEQLF